MANETTSKLEADFNICFQTVACQLVYSQFVNSQLVYSQLDYWSNRLLNKLVYSYKLVYRT